MQQQPGLLAQRSCHSQGSLQEQGENAQCSVCMLCVR